MCHVVLTTMGGLPLSEWRRTEGKYKEGGKWEQEKREGIKSNEKVLKKKNS